MYRYNLPYQKQAQTTLLSLRLISLSKLVKLLAVLFTAIIFISITFQSLGKTNITSKIPIISKGQTKSNGNDVVVIVDGEKQGLSLHPIFCQLSTRKDINTHIIVTGQKRGLSKTLLAKLISEQNISCEVLIYDLDIKTNDETNVLELVFQEISSILNQIQPDILLYVKNKEDYVMRGVDSALFATSHLGITGISVPIEDIKLLTWLPDLSIEALRYWNSLNINIQIITQDRPDSLSRLVRSLKSSRYFGDEISLTINMDRGADPVTKEYCRTLEWPFGQKHLRHRIVQGGLMAAVVESYYPNDDNEYVIMLEDDVEISPYFYMWTKYNILKYRYGPDRKHSNRMYGISYYGSRINELNLSGRRPFDPARSLEGTNYSPRSPYLSQVPCSWGVVFFPEIWREFHDYIPARIQDWNGLRIQNITIPEVRSNGWKNSWKRYLIELVYLRGYVMLYPNYENFTSFSTNHAESGTHIHLREGNHPNDAFEVPLMEEDLFLSGLPNRRMPKYSDLPILDLLGNVVSKEELIQRGRSLHSEVSLCPPSDKLTFDPQDILCLDEEKIQIITNKLASEKAEHKKISDAVKLVANSILNNGKKINRKELLNIVVKKLRGDLTSTGELPSSIPTPTEDQSIETNTNS